jgi:hypothetical protein
MSTAKRTTTETSQRTNTNNKLYNKWNKQVVKIKENLIHNYTLIKHYTLIITL